MILKGSQRSGAKQLGLHLLKTEENEHVELHDIRGFMSDDVVITFTDGQKYDHPSGTTAFNAARYKWVKKKFAASRRFLYTENGFEDR